jgi:histidine triad (HIT) family protein
VDKCRPPRAGNGTLAALWALARGMVITLAVRIVWGRGRRMMTDNIFQKIIDRQIPARIVYEDDQCLAFHDVHPQAPVHVLLIPKKAIRRHADLTKADQALLGHLHLVAAQLAVDLGLSHGYRIVVNCDVQGGQTVPHLHFHIIGGRQMAWPPG